MFSTGHLIWIGICLVLIVGGFIACQRIKPPVRKILKVCLALGALSEVVKIFSVIQILPMVEPAIVMGESGAQLTYAATGQYTPYLEMSHLPLELCSLMIVFIAAALLVKSELWQKRILTLMYITGTVGGTLGILLAYITTDFTTTVEYFNSFRVWQYFLYHAMVVTLGLYMGFRQDSGVSLKSLKSTLALLVALDIPTFYLNSVFSQPVYTAEKPSGVLYRANFFSSYVNPLGLVLTQKWQWMVYLGIRMAIAVTISSLLLWLAGKSQQRRRGSR